MAKKQGQKTKRATVPKSSRKASSSQKSKQRFRASEDDLDDKLLDEKLLDEKLLDEKLDDDKLGDDSDSALKTEEEEELPVELPKEVEQELKQVEAEISKEDKPSSREEDYKLIDDIREGDPRARDNAYKRLLSKYRNQIYSLILKIVHNSEEVEDLVQESFSKAFNSIANFNKEYAFSTWLYRIATNSSIDYLRKRRLKTFSIDNPIKSKDDEYYVEIPDSREEPGKNVMQSQRDQLVREAIAQLPDKYRVVIEMRHLQELAYEEIASELDLPLGTVKAHIFRAREMLYKMLREKLRAY
ncbi:MAG: sigma-70 family RNA polymerase sigma factor [Chloroherpetonaceae bacterium]